MQSQNIIQFSNEVRQLLREQGLLQKDLLPIVKTKSTIADVLSGKRKMNVTHLVGLSEFFQLPVINITHYKHI